MNHNHNHQTQKKHYKTAKSKATRFEDLGLHPRTLQALRRQGIHRQTEIQEKTYDVIRKGSNVVARSRTGTGKTLAFLVPSIERYLALLQQQQQEAQQEESLSHCSNAKQRGIPILVLAPTRELAAQIGKEAEKLLSKHRKHGGHNKRLLLLSSQVVYGGSSKKEDIQRFRKGLPTILVATPGRLKDHLATTTLTHPENPNGVPFHTALQNGNLQTLVLDETDRLLEMGFRRDVQDILSCLNNDTSTPSSFGGSSSNPKHRKSTTATAALPKRTARQTLLFSATLAPGIMDVVDLAISTTPASSASNSDKGSTNTTTNNYQMIDCVHETDLTTHTNTNTSQSYIMLPPERFWTGSIELILQLMATRTTSAKSKQKQKHKIIVFFEMTRLAQLYSKFLSLRLGHTLGVWELHGKMHQRERTVVTRRFRNAPHGVLLTSDVSARGVDYPGVTHVVQVGAPQSRETYIHRLGRTGRNGNHGAGVLVLPDHERDFVTNELEGLGLETDDSLEQGLLSKKNNAQSVRKDLENELGMLKHDLKSGGDDHTGMLETVTLAYHSLVSYYFQTKRRRRRRSQDETLDQTRASSSSSLEPTVTMLNQLIIDFGLPELPSIGFQRAKNMGIEHLSGHLNIRKNWEDQNWNIATNTRIDGGDDSESEKNNHGDYDDWFGLSKGATATQEAVRGNDDNSSSSSSSLPRQTTSRSNHNKNRNGTGNNASSVVRSTHLTKQNQKTTTTTKKAPKRKKNKNDETETRFEDRQRYNHYGE